MPFIVIMLNQPMQKKSSVKLSAVFNISQIVTKGDVFFVWFYSLKHSPCCVPKCAIGITDALMQVPRHKDAYDSFINFNFLLIYPHFIDTMESYVLSGITTKLRIYLGKAYRIYAILSSQYQQLCSMRLFDSQSIQSTDPIIQDT